MNQDHDHSSHATGLIGGEIHFDNLFQFLVDILEHSLILTAFVLVMMLLIEYLTVQTRGRWNSSIEKNPFLQILIAAILGLTPGCLGVYIIVTLYAHRMVNFAALVAAMIATSGDEAFIMFAMIPEKALIIMGALFLVAMITGLFLNLFPVGRSMMTLEKNHLQVHQQESACTCWDPGLIWPQMKKISFERSILLGAGIIYSLFLISGKIGPEEWDWKRIIFLFVSLVEVFIAATVPDHFLSKHLWGHVVKKHFLKVFLWTFGALLLIHVGMEYLRIEEWIGNNQVIILLTALTVGIIPESGPHIAFITLYAQGLIPIGILLANSIVQDGHGALPLLAESRKAFVKMKLINLLVGLIIGIIFLLIV